VFRELSVQALNYWKTLYEEVVLEKLFEHTLPTSMKYVTWESGNDTHDMKLAPLPKDQTYVLRTAKNHCLS